MRATSDTQRAPREARCWQIVRADKMSSLFGYPRPACSDSRPPLLHHFTDKSDIPIPVLAGSGTKAGSCPQETGSGTPGNAAISATDCAALISCGVQGTERSPSREGWRYFFAGFALGRTPAHIAIYCYCVLHGLTVSRVGRNVRELLSEFEFQLRQHRWQSDAPNADIMAYVRNLRSQRRGNNSILI